MQESVIDATQSTSRLREDVQSLTDWVLSGAFREQLQQSVGPQTGRDCWGGAVHECVYDCVRECVFVFVCMCVCAKIIGRGTHIIAASYNA